MPVTAEFRLVEKSRLNELKKLAEIVIIGGFFRKTVIDTYPSYLKTNSTQLASFEHSDSVFGNLFAFLLKEKNIDLLYSEYDCIAKEISRKRKISAIFFTKTQKDKYLEQLYPDDYSMDELEEFNLGFSQESDPDLALAEIEGIKVIGQSLQSIPDDNHVVLMTIGNFK